MISRESDLVDGIPGGQETGLPTSNANAQTVTSCSDEVPSLALMLANYFIFVLRFAFCSFKRTRFLDFLDRE